MYGEYTNEPMLEMFIYETSQLIEQLEQLVLVSEKESGYSKQTVDEIFRIMHTIKGSSAMMLFNNISALAHAVEDLFFIIREDKPEQVDYSILSDLVLEAVDFIKVELAKIKNGSAADGNADFIIGNIKDFISCLKTENPLVELQDRPAQEGKKKQQYYISQLKTAKSGQSKWFQATVFFKEGCEMENLRAFTIIHNLKDITSEYHHEPVDIMNDDSVGQIREQGFTVLLRTDRSYEEMHAFFMQTIFLKDLVFTELDNDELIKPGNDIAAITLSDNPVIIPQLDEQPGIEQTVNKSSVQQSIISVNVAKLDYLMDLVGELVIAEAMVTENPELNDLELDNFRKAARRLRKISSELQDAVMSIRMVPLAATFQKMQRTVRDMSKKLNKDIRLELVGEDTEVDKNVIEHISDPLMHLIRNAIDHGLETPAERQAKGKEPQGTVTLSANHAGSDVVVSVKDDGRGLNKDKLLAKAYQNGLLTKPAEEMTDKEIYSLILLPGFSTKEDVTEFSGRGVGMDVVLKNIESVGGSVTIDSAVDAGTQIALKIPLTLAIIDGMNIRVGTSRFTVPTIAIKQSFRPQEADIITDPDGNEMIMVRGSCYPVMRLHERYDIRSGIKEITNGIVIMVEHNEKVLCLVADELLGQQQVVVKALPDYIKKTKKIQGLAGCTLLGDGSISLILDIAGVMNDGYK